MDMSHADKAWFYRLFEPLQVSPHLSVRATPRCQAQGQWWPRAAARRGRLVDPAEGGEQEEGRHPGEEERVDPVEDAAVAAEQAAAVLDAHVPLEGRLEQVAERLRDRDHRAEDERLPDRQE